MFDENEINEDLNQENENNVAEQGEVSTEVSAEQSQQEEEKNDEVQRPYQQFMNQSNQENYVWNSQPVQSQQNQSSKPPKRKGGARAAAAVIAGIIVMAGGVMTLTGGWNKLFGDNESGTRTQISSTLEENQKQQETANVEKTTVEISKNTTSSSGQIVLTDVSKVVEDVMPSIVAITSKAIVESGNYGWGYWYGNGKEEEIDAGAGSGIIVQQTDTELLIVTNNHVVEGASSLSVQFINGESVEAVVKGTDSKNDLAVVAIPIEKINEDTLKAIKKATIGDSDQMQVGEGVIAIGNALGYGQSVTTGIVSALNREVEIDNTTMTMLQTDAAINGGNSGGALLNSKGEVIGINSAKYSSNGYSSASIEGMGFAIPISSATDIINELMNKTTRTKVEESKRGYLGITGADVTDEYVERLGMPYGVLVSKVEDGSAAEEAGIQVRDVITAVDGTAVESMSELKEQLAYYAAGDQVTITIQYAENREYTSKDVVVTLQKSSN